MQTQLNDEITPQQAGTLHGLFVERVRRTPDKVAYRFFERNAWHDITWHEMERETARWQTALGTLGLQRGDRVALMLRNCPCWMRVDQAAMSLGLVIVPLYTVDRPDNIAYIVNDADVKVLVFENAEQWQALRTVSDQMAGMVRFVSLDNMRDAGESRMVCMDDFLPASAVLQPEQLCPADTLASIIYTSGTTGKPKGVMLSHANMLINAHACLEFFPVGRDDLLLSFLPLSHTFERTVGYYLTVMAGATVAFARSIPQLSEDLRTIHPTLLISVPRIYERIYGTVQTALRESTPLKRKLFNFTVETGWAHFLYQQGRGPWQASFLLWPLLHKVVAQTVLDHLGGKLRVALSGGAALPPEISRMFIGLGLPVIQGYGLTETSPVISANRLDNNFPDSVGLPISGIEVRTGEQGELLVKGPNVMLGYWNNPAATRAIIDPEGWLNTGDVVRISDTGHIYITGRTKEIIVMSNGEKVPPSDMEHAILRDPLFDQVMVIGEARPCLSALVVLNPDEWKRFAQEVGIRPDIPEALHDSRVEAKVLKRIALNLRDFPGYANVRRVLLLTEPWSVDNGLLTPTLKLMRPRVYARFAQQIEAFYERH